MNKLKETYNLCRHPKNPHGAILTATGLAADELFAHCTCYAPHLFLALLLWYPSIWLKDDYTFPYLFWLLEALKMVNACFSLFYYGKFCFLFCRYTYLTWCLHPAQKDAIKAYQ